MAAPSHSYVPLKGTGNIRLLSLLPGHVQAPLEGVLTTVSLSDPQVEFDALSYCWDNPQDKNSPFYAPFDIMPYEILVNGASLRIKQNLKDALLHLRKHSGRLWIDAICINQGDEDEKSEQILLMREIYSKAKSVVVWLGRSDPTSDEAVQVILQSREDALMSLIGRPSSSPQFLRKNPVSRSSQPQGKRRL